MKPPETWLPLSCHACGDTGTITTEEPYRDKEGTENGQTVVRAWRCNCSRGNRYPGLEPVQGRR